jgi:hypothetical protein
MAKALLLPLRLVGCLLVSLEPTWGHELEKRKKETVETKLGDKQEFCLATNTPALVAFMN